VPQEEVVEEERSLLTTLWSKTFWSGRAFEVKLAAKLLAFINTGCSNVKCSNEASIKLGFEIGVNVCERPVWAEFAFTKKAAYPGSSVTIAKTTQFTFKLFCKLSDNWTVSVTIIDEELSTNEEEETEEETYTTPHFTILVFYIIDLTGYFGFGAGNIISPGVDGFNSKGAGEWGCVKKCHPGGQRYTSGSKRGQVIPGSHYTPLSSWRNAYRCTSRRDRNRGSRQNSIYYQYQYITTRNWQWWREETPEILGFIKTSSSKRRYNQMNSDFYTSASCTVKYYGSKTRFRIKVSWTIYNELSVNVEVATLCFGSNVVIGLEVVGRLMSHTVSMGRYIVMGGTGDCWYISYAQDGAKVTIAPYLEARWGYAHGSWCAANSWKMLETWMKSLTIVMKFDMVISAHLWMALYPWLVFGCSTSSPNDCNIAETSATFWKPIYFSYKCRYTTYALEPIYGGAKKFNVYY